MPLKSLHIKNLRNLTNVQLALHPSVNLFCGLNGAGKSSVLEAISLLGRGRSFRTHKIKPLIQQCQNELLVFGALAETGEIHRLGVERSRSNKDVFRLDGKNVASAASLAKVLPIQSLYSETFRLISGSPTDRRQFLDWLVFHVEPNFYPAWQQVSRALKQRNSLLRSDRIDASAIQVWDDLLVQQADLLDTCRNRVFQLFNAAYQQLGHQLTALNGITLEYQRGWANHESLKTLLAKNLIRDRKVGYTRIGPHRADIRMRLNKQPVEDILSRGQQKLLAYALKVCAGQVFKDLTGRSCIYLLDDLPAELDSDSRYLLAGWLEDLGAQVFVTGIDADQVADAWQKRNSSFTLFHVEQGEIKTTNR